MKAAHDQKHIARSVRHAAQCYIGTRPSLHLSDCLSAVMRKMCVVFAASISLIGSSGCLVNDSAVMPKPSWIERAFVPRPSRLAEPVDRLEFERIAKFRRQTGELGLRKETALLREGDLVAARLGKLRSGRDLFLKGETYAAGYTFFKYGHLDLVLRDPGGGDQLVLFTCNGTEGVNIKRHLSDLGNRDWDVYRMKDWNRVDRERLLEFVRTTIIQEKGGESYDDFSALGFRNANLKPRTQADIGGGYTCSTVIAAALYYAGVELDKTRGSSHVDIVTPKQVVTSKGRFFRVPNSETNSGQ